MKINNNRILKLKDGDYYLIEDKEIPLDEICNHCALTNFCDEISDNLNRIDYFLCHEMVKDTKYAKRHKHSYFIKLTNGHTKI